MKKKHLSLSLLLFAFILLLFYSEASANTRPRAFTQQGQFGAVSSGHPIATSAAVKILKNGGNAIDAAVCAAFMLGVVDFTNSGPGGDAFALVHLSSGEILSFDGSIKRPIETGDSNSDIGLPTAPELLLRILKTFGTCTPAEILAPSIKVCQRGFEVSSYLHQVIRKKLLKLEYRPAIEFLAPDGYAMPAGTILKQPVLAKTLAQIARDNGESFYRGEHARVLVDHMRANGSGYSIKDFENYKSKVSLPFKFEWQSYCLYGTPPPSSSVAAIKLATKLADSDLDLFNPGAKAVVSIAQTGQKIIDFKYNFLSNYLHCPERFIKDSEGAAGTESDVVKADDSLTTHLCVWDKDNNAVSITLTLGSHCGTGHLSPLGFFYNNEMRNYKEIVARYPQNYDKNAGPISSKSPMMIKKGARLAAILGGAGSDRIIFNTGLIAAKFLRQRSEDENFFNLPRFFLDYKNTLQLEWHKDGELLKQISTLWPTINIRESGDDYFGLMAGIFKTNKGLRAFGDFRRDGSCAAISRNPLESAKLHIRLNFSRKKGFEKLLLGGPISDMLQTSSDWSSSAGARQTKSENQTTFDYETPTFADVFSIHINRQPQREFTSKELVRLLGQKPNFDPTFTDNPALLEFCTQYSDCQSIFELSQRLLVDVGFQIPYRRVKRKTTATQILEMGFGDCSGKARLMHEVLRAYGANSRLVGGLIAKNGIKSSTHLWLEIGTNSGWIPVCPVNFHFGQIPGNWVKLRYGEIQTVTPGGKLIFNISKE